MKRRRSSAPGLLRPDGRWSHPILLAALLIALVACGQATATDQPSASGASVPTSDTTAAPVTGTPNGEPTVSTEPSASQPSATTSARPPTDPGSAASCGGSAENRDFYASMAAAVDWTVYCPVLPDGWFVDDGQYRLANGGWLEISYDGPGDARIMLEQGAFCRDGGGCVPSGREVGETAFGDRTGVLVAGDEGSWSVVVDRGATPSWLLTVTGMDEANARTIASELLAVAS